MPERPEYGWLCPTEAHRARMLDMSPRVKRARAMAMGANGIGMVAASPIVGWPMVPVFAVALLVMFTIDWRVARAERAERPIAQAMLMMIVLTGVSAVLTGGPASPVLPLLVVPVAVASARFRTPVVWAGAGAAMVVALAASLSQGPQHLFDEPLMLISVVVLLIAVTAATTALMDAEFEFRSQSVLDSLTGLLNRGGLESRFAEVSEQARLLNQPVCMVACDLDHFKTVNDTFGHDRGDTVLREVTYEMRKSLRSFELFYRTGGEEFLVLLPGIDLGGGIHIAENMRAAVERSHPGGLEITASFGVSVSAGEDIEFGSLYRAADESLYEAKRAGRNRVAAAGVVLPGGAVEAGAGAAALADR
jgi:diguanylate cyclase (GGDEF)-like protein